MNLLKSTVSRIAFAVLFLGAGFVPAASAATSTFQILLDLDNHQNTGCDVATLTGTFQGVEQILTTTVVTGGSSAQVTAATVKSCVSGTTFGAASPVTPPAGHPLPWQVGVSNGTGGTSVIETFYPLSLSPVTKPPIVRLAVLAFDNGAVLRDELVKTQPNPGNGPPILLQGASIAEIPTLSEWGLLFLGLVLAVAAVALLRRRTVIAVLLAVLLLGAAGVAWAAVCDLNGTTIGEWNIATLLASEPTSDAPAGTDMRAFYGFKDAALNALCFRIDALLLFNTPPTANADAATVVEDAAATPVNVLANDTDPDVGDTLTIQSVTQPANGTVVITGGGTGLTYKPNANYCNTPPGTTLDTFTYTLAPGGPTTTATVSMTVTCVDDNPAAVNDTATVAEDAPATPINVLANDTDPDGGAKSITSVTQPANGAVVITGGGTGLTYQPNANYCNLPPGTAPDTFTYTLTPGGATATVSVTVTCADDAPVAVDDAATVVEDSGANAINVLANDTDIDAGPKSVTAVTQPANGTVAITGGGTGLTYTPNADYCNTPPGTTLDTFTYTLTPGGSIATVTVTVTCADDAPVAVADSATVVEDSGANAINVLANDTDTDGGPISIASVTQPANGTVAITGGGTGLTYTPNADYCNTPPGTFDTFTYTLTPGTSTATVSVTVTCVDDNPVAVNDAATVVEDSGANAINVLANDTDVDGGPKSVTAVTQPANGTVVITGGGTGVTYAPNANYCNNPPGTFDTFTYTLTPGGSTATVSVSVTCADDAPVAVNDAATVAEDSGANAINVLANDTDLDGGPKLVQSVTQPANGTVVITGGGTGVTYAPNADYCNTPPGTFDTFTYALTPGGSTATVSVTVTCLNDAPVIDLDADNSQGTTGSDFAVTFTEGNPAVLLEDPTDATVTDVDSPTLASLTVTITNLLDTGSEILSADVTGTSITANYVAATGVLTLTGPDTLANFQTVLRKVRYQNTDVDPDTTARVIHFVANDGITNSNTATSTVTVVSVDTPPTAVNDSATVNEDSGANPIPVLTNDTDPDNGPISIASVTQPANGTVVITGGGTGLTYAPNANYCNSVSGPLDTFTYTLTPGGSTATVSVTVTCVDDNPVAVPDSATVVEDSGANPINVLANDTDADGGPISVGSVTQPANGTVAITGGGTGVSYTPNANYCNSVSGPADTFTYTLAPGGSSTTVTVTVTCVDDNPVAVADAATVAEDSGANAINVLANDTDPDGGPKSVASVTQPANGTVVITGGGTGVTYAPNANYCNTPPGTTPDTFTYTLAPGGSSTTVTVSVTCVDDAPVAVNDAATVAEDSGANAIDVLANDTDLDGGPKLVQSVTQPANGAVVITGGGTGVTYAPNANYCNTPPGTFDTFTYALMPGGSTATVSVSVTCVNDAPVIDLDADNSQGTTGSDFAVTFTEGNPAVLLEDPTDATVTDVDSPTLASLTVTITNLLDTGSEILSTDVTGTSITANYVAATGVLTLTGPDTLANFQTVLRKVRYQNTDGDPDTTPRVIHFVANDGITNGNTATSTVTVVAIDTPPTAVNDSATVNEDSGANAINVLANDTDPDNGPISITSVTQPANGTVVITGGGTGLTYAPNANYCNSVSGPLDTFTYTLTPGGSTATVSVTVTCVDDNPVAVADAATVIEDSGANAINVLANDTDPDGGPISITSVTQPANGTVVITGGGTGLTYAPNANYCNTPPGTTLSTFTYTLTPGGSSTTVTVTVTCVDDNPVAVADAATVVEDSGANAINVLANDTDVDGGPKSVGAVTQPANGTVLITGGGTGLTYAPAPNYCNNPPGTTLDTFTYTLTPGGSSTTVTVTVTCVDDPPVAVADSATVIEDSGANAINVLANDTDVDAGPKSIASVTQPANGAVVITGGGTGLTYAPNLNYCNMPPGTTPDTFTYTLTPGGSSTTVSVLVTCVNDPPVAGSDTFDTIGNTELRVDLAVGSTPAVKKDTASTFGVLNNDSDPVENNAIVVSGIVGCADITAPFGDSPACSTVNGGTVVMESNGRFSYKPKAGDTAASDSFQYTIQDDGVPAPASATGLVTINRFERVWYVKNDAAAGGLGRSHDPFDTLAEAQAASSANDYIFVYFGNGATTGQAAGIVLKNGQHLIGEHAGLSIPVSLNGKPSPTDLVTAVVGNRPLLDNTAAGGNAVSATDAIPAEVWGLNLAGNTNAIDLTTNGAFAGSGTFEIRDNVVRSTGIEGIDINQNGTGSLNLKIHNNTITAGVRGIDVLRTAGTCTISAFNDNTITGNTGGSGIEITGVIFDAIPGLPITQVLGGTTAIGQSGNGVATNGILLTNVVGELAFDDLDIFNDAGAGLRVTSTGALNAAAGTGFQLSVASGTGSIDSNGGPAVDVSNVSLNLPLLTFLRSTNSTTTGLSLVNAFGGAGSTTLSASSGQIADPVGASGTAVNISGGNGNITLGIPVISTSGNAVVATGRTSDTVSFSGTISETGSGISLTSNAGATISFTGAITASTGANPAFTATGGGTVTTTDTTSTLTTTTGIALNVANTNIGAGGLKFRSISAGTAASGPANGIVLNTTGALGGLTVSGTGSAGSGGTIRKGATGISLTSTRNVSLSWMQLNDFTDFAIRGSSVVNFSMSNTVINGTNGDDPAANEGSVRFTELTGTATISNSNVSGSVEDTFAVVNTTGSLNRITFTGDTFGANSTTTGDNGLLLEAQSSAVLNATVQNSFFTSSRGDLVQATITSGATGSMDVVFTGNTLSDNHPAIVAGGGGVLFGGVGGTFTYNIATNTFRDATGDALVVSCGGVGSTCTGRIETNQIGLAGTANSGSTGGSGIALVSAAGGNFTSLVNGNIIRQYNNTGIRLQAGDQMGNPLSFNATVTGNTVGNPGSINTNFNGIQLNNGTVASDNFTSCVDIRSNSIAGSGSGAVSPNNADFRLRQRQSTTVRLPGYGGANNNDAAVVAFVSGNNTVSTGASSNTVPTGGGYVGGASCPTPP